MQEIEITPEMAQELDAMGAGVVSASYEGDEK